MEKTNELHTAGAGLLPFDPIILLRDVLKRWLVIVLWLWRWESAPIS